jgi:hypothetical protein
VRAGKDHLDHAKIFLLSKVKIRGQDRNYVACVSSSNFYKSSVSDRIQDMVCTYGNKDIYERIRDSYWKSASGGGYRPLDTTFGNDILNINNVDPSQIDQYDEWKNYFKEFADDDDSYIDDWDDSAHYYNYDFDKFTPLAIDFDMFNYDNGDDLKEHIKVVTFGATIPHRYNMNDEPGILCSKPQRNYPCIVKQLIKEKIDAYGQDQLGDAHFVQAQYDADPDKKSTDFFWRFHEEDYPYDLRWDVYGFKDNMYFLSKKGSGDSGGGSSPGYPMYDYLAFLKIRIPETHTKIFHVRNLGETAVLMGSRNAKYYGVNEVDFYIKDKANTQSDIVHHYDKFIDYLMNLCVELGTQKNKEGETESVDKYYNNGNCEYQ